MTRTKGTPNVGDARHARAVHAVLGDRGTIGEGRRAVGYAFHARCDAYHIAPRYAYDRARDRMNYGGRGDARVSWPMRAYVAEGTGAVVVRDMNDTRTLAGMSQSLRASLTRVRYAGGEAWRLRAMQRASA